MSFKKITQKIRPQYQGLSLNLDRMYKDFLTYVDYKIFYLYYGVDKRVNFIITMFTK